MASFPVLAFLCMRNIHELYTIQERYNLTVFIRYVHVMHHFPTKRLQSAKQRNTHHRINNITYCIVVVVL